MIDLKQQILDTQRVYREGMTAGMAGPDRRKLEAILAAYERTKNDPQQKLSTLLMCAIECARA